MNSKLASHKHIFFKVKVILNKVKINNPWIDFKWKVYDILPQEIIVGNNKYPATFISPEPLKKIQNQQKHIDLKEKRREQDYQKKILPKPSN